jgi:SAM-dependent methyltransferase
MFAEVNQNVSSAYDDVVQFWNRAFEMSETEKDQFTQEFDPENGWKELAPSEKLRDILVENLSDCQNVLDYGCGEGWAGIALSKTGCENVTCVDVSENAVKFAAFLGHICGAGTGFQTECVSPYWIEKAKEDSFDGVFCSNVVDVLPSDIAEDIIKNIARIAEKGAKIIISMNYYQKAVSRPEKNLEVRNGNEIYINGILRMVSRTDEEWSEILGRYFDVERIEHFSWPGETEETRRIYILKNK